MADEWMNPPALHRCVVVPSLDYARAERVRLQAVYPGYTVVAALAAVPALRFQRIVSIWRPKKARDFSWLDGSVLPRLRPGGKLEWAQ
jgi:hypothetical protein